MYVDLWFTGTNMLPADPDKIWPSYVMFIYSSNVLFTYEPCELIIHMLSCHWLQIKLILNVNDFNHKKSTLEQSLDRQC